MAAMQMRQVMMAQQMERLRAQKAAMENSEQAEAIVEEEIQPKAPEMTEDKVGRNDPCPCGSGKKFKNCHGQV